MPHFAHAHATHRDPREAFGLAATQLERRAPTSPTLGWLYLTDHLANQAPMLLALAQERWPGVAWVGAVGVGICASGIEYFDRPALALMLSDVPREQFRVFSGTAPLQRDGFAPHTALVHADPATPELGDLIGELSARTTSGYLFGGLASARTKTLTIADDVFQGGLSGVAFGESVGLVSRVTQGCQPVGPAHRIDLADGNLVVELDKQPALGRMLEDLGVAKVSARDALTRVRETLVGLADRPEPAGMNRQAFGPDVRVRHLVGLDPRRQAIAIADVPEPGTTLAFCMRDIAAARRDLTRVCAEVREELEPVDVLASACAAESAASYIGGAVYVSCAGRGGLHFGAPSAEMAIVQRALGDVPLVGFFAAGEIGHRHVYGYTGVLTAFSK
jgi:small ligand-binding sensory domain FIST